MDYDESSDILGGRLHVSPQTSSAWSDPGQITLLLGLGLAAFYTWARLAPHYRQWKETRYKKATRRRHGIPDDDNRPFNVAYAAALQAKNQREGKGRPFMRNGPELVVGHGGTAATSGPPIVPSYVGYGNGYPLPSVKVEASQSSLGPRPDIPTVRSATQRERTPQMLPRSLPNGSAARKPRLSGVKQPLTTRTSYGKHALDDESDFEPEMLAKKSRLEGEELIDGDEQAEWHGSDKDMEVDEAQPVKRGSKRVASSEDDEGLDDSRTVRCDKRARKVSLDKSVLSPDEHMGKELEDGEEEDGEEEDGEDVEDIVRGKKRDRMEAGSTFGGDGDVMDDEGEKPKRRRRKGRVSNKLEASLTRGQKRGRGSHSTESDDSESERPKQRVTRKKRGRKSQEDVIPLSNDPLCRGRPIGEEWESHGILFKVGPNGQRLRQELVKKLRSKFPMPSDSQHPDRRAHVDVYVEVWLSEEEYKLAKERHELAWQDSSPTPPELQIPDNVLESPSKIAGKNLLWSSTISSRDSPVKRGPLKQSVATNAGSRLTIFPPPPAISTRRISSVYHAPASPAAESPKMQKTKSYSKWEKQDLEAAAMSKIRDRQQSAREGNGSKASPLSTTSSTAHAASTPTATPPLFGAPSPAADSNKAPEKPPTSTAPSTFTFPSSNTTTTVPVAKAGTTEPPKINTMPVGPATSDALSKSAATPFAPLAPASSSATVTPMSAPQPAAPQTGSSIPNFFAKPAAPATAAASAPEPASTTSAVPNFFAKPAVPQDATSAAMTATTPGPTNTAPKPSFAFGFPSTQQAATMTVSPFGNASSDSAKTTEQAKATPGASLLSRIGMGPPPSQPAASSPFSFVKPETTASGASTTTEAAKAPNAAPAAAVSSTLKFNFGVTSKPSSTSSTPAPTVTGAATAPAVPSAPASTPAPASSTPKFSFGVTGSSQPAAAAPTNPFGGTAANATTPLSAAKSTFSFGATAAPTSTPGPFSGAPSVKPTFGVPSGASSTPSPFGAAAANAAKPTEAVKMTFGFGATNVAPSTTNASPFGAPASASSSPPFGAPAASSAPSPFGTTSSNTAKPEAPKSAFSFGNTGPSSSTKPTSFGNTAQKTDTQAAKPLFGFGSLSTPAPAFGATSVPAGEESKPTFGFGAPASGTMTGPSAAPAASSSASPFSFDFGQSPSTTNPSSTPVASGPQNNGQGSSSFSFGTPSGGAFSFGSNSGQSQQK